MPRAYCLLAGLTQVDEQNAYYRRKLPGFDSRRGCEGCRADVEKMDRLAHYLGYERVTAKPLLDAEATRARLLAALEMVADSSSPIQPGDIFLFYLSCHGQTLGDGPTRRQNSPVGNAVNIFLLHDRPVTNFDLRFALLKLVDRGVRVVTVIDACHAGLGSNLVGAGAKPPTGFLGLVNETARAADERLIAAFGLQISRLPSGTVVSPTVLSKRLDEQKAMFSKLHSSKVAGSGKKSGLAHFGAVRDEGRALGGEDGSLFTRLFYSLFVNGGDGLRYRQFAEEVEVRMPPQHPPVFEPSDAQDFGADCFLEKETVLQIH